jgi:FixJ family two-component response regulator
MSSKATIFIVDDDEGLRRGLQALLDGRGFATKCYASAEALLDGLPPDATGCLVVDVRMPGMSGLDLQRELKRRQVGLPVIVITGHGDIPMAVAALKVGAVDFLEKPFDSPAILASIEDALRTGETRVETDVSERFKDLTPREREVMDLVVAGQTNKAIAHRLKIAMRTVEIHRARVMEKTGTRNLSELVRLAIRLEGSA